MDKAKFSLGYLSAIILKRYERDIDGNNKPS